MGVSLSVPLRGSRGIPRGCGPSGGSKCVFAVGESRGWSPVGVPLGDPCRVSPVRCPRGGLQ